MIEAVQKRLSLRSRQKIYLIIVFVSLILLFYSAWQVGPVYVEPEAPLGLVSYLSPAYWAGLALVVVTSILAFLDRELKKDAIFIVILIALGLFLLGIRVFVEENALDSDSYYPTSEVFNLLSAGKLDLANAPSIATYYAWPATHFISAWLLEMTGIDLIPIMKYTPLFWIPCFVFISYAIGKRLELAPNHCFLLSFLAVASWLVPFAGFYYPRLPATIFFLLLFMLLVSPRKTAAETVLVILMFGVLVLTHGLTSVAVLPGLVLLAIYRRETRFVLLFIVIFGAWYVYQATTAMEAGINALLAPMRNVMEIAQIERYQEASAVGRYFARYSQLGYVVLYGLFMLGSIVLLLRRKITGERRKQVIAILAWIIGVGLVVFWGHGEGMWRVYIYCLVPMVCIVALLFYSRRLLVPLMCLFVVLSLFANYTTLAGFGQVTTSGLKGAQFFALEVIPQQRYFAHFSAKQALYYNPDLIRIPMTVSKSFIGELEDGDVSPLDEYRYVVFSKVTSDQVRFEWGEDPYLAWPQTEAGQGSDLIYDNGDFQIYENPPVYEYPCEGE